MLSQDPVPNLTKRSIPFVLKQTLTCSLCCQRLSSSYPVAELPARQAIGWGIRHKNHLKLPQTLQAPRSITLADNVQPRSLS